MPERDLDDMEFCERTELSVEEAITEGIFALEHPGPPERPDAARAVRVLQELRRAVLSPIARTDEPDLNALIGAALRDAAARFQGSPLGKDYAWARNEWAGRERCPTYDALFEGYDKLRRDLTAAEEREATARTEIERVAKDMRGHVESEWRGGDDEFWVRITHVRKWLAALDSVLGAESTKEGE